MVTEQVCGEIQCDLIFVFSKHTLGKALKKKSAGSQDWYEQIVHSCNIKKAQILVNFSGGHFGNRIIRNQVNF